MLFLFMEIVVLSLLRTETKVKKKRNFHERIFGTLMHLLEEMGDWDVFRPKAIHHSKFDKELTSFH